MSLNLESYTAQTARWPKTGKHILAHFDDETIVVYQAYKPATGHFAAKQGYLGGEFSLNRMSWIKPNFLWMMYRSGWGTKENQEITLAVRIRREAFDTILKLAVHSSFVPEIYGTEEIWKTALADATVRLQWDPDHHPSGAKLERRALQLGLRGTTLASYARDWIISIEDICDLVQDQYRFVLASQFDKLTTPYETVYPVSDSETAAKLGISVW